MGWGGTMIPMVYVFEGSFKKGMRSAGKSLLAGTGMALKGAGQAVTTIGDTINTRFSKDEKEKTK